MFLNRPVQRRQAPPLDHSPEVNYGEVTLMNPWLPVAGMFYRFHGAVAANGLQQRPECIQGGRCLQTL